jgi:SAM-dependent MidA family methyltransferase
VPDNLPLPDVEARELSAQLVQVLRARIEAAGGCLAFDAFMDLALYESRLGYYCNAVPLFGAEGDFVTAPESGGLFARCLAQSVACVLAQTGPASVLEVGAGSGALALDLLGELQNLGRLPQRYLILERSGALRAEQRRTLERNSALAALVEWVDAVPEAPFHGVVLANEVADALPVKRFCWSEAEVTELGVGWRDGRLAECCMAADPELRLRVQSLARSGGWDEHYCSEYCPSLATWLADLARPLEQGLLLLIDYGYGRAEYYHAQRVMGTLMCHYRHRAHADALWFPGLQDITAFVDFTAVAEAASDAGLSLEGFSSQAQFLVACGIDRILAQADAGDLPRFLRLSNEAKRLLLPGEMGERFKVAGFSRRLRQPVTGFGARDLRSRL